MVEIEKCGGSFQDGDVVDVWWAVLVIRYQKSFVRKLSFYRLTERHTSSFVPFRLFYMQATQFYSS